MGKASRKLEKRKGNTELLILRRFLRNSSRKYEVRIWRAVGDMLVKPKRQKVQVNLAKINRNSKDGDRVIVPGKVLSSGNLDHNVTVAAYDFTQKAIEKIEKSGGEAISIKEIVKRDPSGSGIKPSG